MILSNEFEKNKKRILIVDDSQLNREMLMEILGDEYVYSCAGDGETALAMLSANLQVDILLLDMQMPGMSGMDVLKVMKEYRWTEEIPVVIISAEDDIGFVQNAYRLGAIDYIVRPFNAFLLQHRVKNSIMLYSQNKKLVKLVRNQVDQREKVNNMLIHIFSHVVEVGNRESGNHTLRVQRTTNMILNQLVKITDKYDLSESDIAMISSLSSLHDIGKILIPDEILNKAGKLTDEEWEIMKSHTVQGDQFLDEIQVDPNEQLMILAHEICRHHHERYDGKGYPDGLKGDNIPISAQVVSIADVYDALVSNRCYKNAVSHEEALEMIFNGECGTFNPLLLQCLAEIESMLPEELAADGNWFENDVQLLAAEVLESENLNLESRNFNLLECEREKKEFFASKSGGIQFEYDAVRKKTLYIQYYEGDECVRLSNTETYLLGEKDWDLLQEKVAQTTRDNSVVSMNALVPINGDLRWHKLMVKTIWAQGIDSYVSIVGQFTDIHDEIIEKCASNLCINGQTITGDNMLAMRKVFDLVRLVDPKDCNLLKIQEDGTVISSNQKCYSIWGRREGCMNCTSSRALENKNWMSKLEIKDGQIYSVLSRSAKYGDNDCILEVAMCVEDAFRRTKSGIGFIPDSDTLQVFYRDTVTKAYSRAYFDNFTGNLENSLGVAVADVDDFKHINDTYGHRVGDMALRHISEQIRATMRENDVLIRYGGDEFLLLFKDISEREFFHMLESIKMAVHESKMTDYPDLQLDISIGGNYGESPLLKAIDLADKAMYRDKFRIKER